MKVASHLRPDQTHGNEVPAVSEECIQIKNGFIQRRNGHLRRTLPKAEDFRSSARSLRHCSSRFLCKKLRGQNAEIAEVEKSSIEQNLSYSSINYAASKDLSILKRSCDVTTDKDGNCVLLSEVASGNWKLSMASGDVSENPRDSSHVEGCFMSSKSNSSRVYLEGCDTPDMARCEWSNCVSYKVDAESLLEHIRSVHIATQIKPLTSKASDFIASVADEEPAYVCLWAGCKVYNKASCLLSWLERHIHCHVGAKPHRCIVAGCGARFASQFMLQRHVNGHFTMVASPSISALRPSRRNDAINKLTKKRKLRFLRPCPVRFDDYFDSCVMESIRKELIKCAENSPLMSEKSISGTTITFQRSIVARRITTCGNAEVLLHWKPSDVFPDEWLSESEALLVTSRTLPLSCLPCDKSHKIWHQPLTKQFHRHRRK